MSRPVCRSFAVRQVNPYDGVLQVVETGRARAYSSNGRVWQIQVLAERPDHTWRSLGHSSPIMQFFNFGLWDRVDGLHRIPANPMLDLGAMTAASDEMALTLNALHDKVPFALADRYECWSIDRDDRPVALLATTEDPAFIPELRVAPWQATRSADHGFVAPSMPPTDTRQADKTGPRDHAAILEQAIRQYGASIQWFERLDSGQARRMETAGDRSSAQVTLDFPPLMLRTEWTEAPLCRLVQDYIDWQAPYLLLLDGLADDLRRHLEVVACRRATELATVYRLLPRIIDPQTVSAARVEAQLRRAR
jgi:hypothetical protein